MSAVRPTSRPHHAASDMPDGSAVDLDARIDEILARHPSVGLALGVVRDGRLAFFRGHGLADIASRTPITEDTVFRIGSVTKTMTAIAVMQLWEQGRVDLDAPANRYLRAFRLIPVQQGWRPATLRHLLTHTAGVPDLRRFSDLLHAGLTPNDGRPPLLSVPFGGALPPLAEHYREGLRVVVEPGTTFAYSNPSFAALGQVVEDVSGEPIDRYLRDRLFRPLGMGDTDLVRDGRLAARLATGYAFGGLGPRAVPDRDWVGAAGGGVYSTPRDLSRYAAALLAGGANDRGQVLRPATLATMFEPHFQPDPRIPGMGLGVFRGDVAGHRIIVHDGILPGFNAELLLAPEDGIGLFAVTNGSAGAFAWLPDELDRLLRQLLAVPEAGNAGVAQHPEVWAGVCGRYVLPRVADARERLVLGGGVSVLVRGGRLVARVLTPLPALWRGMPLDAADARDPYAFRIDLSGVAMGPARVVFGPVVDGRATGLHTDLGGQPWSLRRTPDPGERQPLALPVASLLAVAGAAIAVRGRRRRSSR